MSAVTFYFAPYEDVFIVDVDPVTGVHRVSIDPSYHYILTTADDDSTLDHMPLTQFRDQKRRRRYTDPSFYPSFSGLDTSTLAWNSSSSTGEDDESGNFEKVHRLVERNARRHVTYIEVPHPDTILIVRNVRDRLVVMLPNAIHKLKVIIGCFEI